jgi:putative copper export protein
MLPAMTSLVDRLLPEALWQRLQPLRRLVLIEVIIAIAVLAITALLGVATPPEAA